VTSCCGWRSAVSEKAAPNFCNRRAGQRVLKSFPLIPDVCLMAGEGENAESKFENRLPRPTMPWEELVVRQF